MDNQETASLDSLLDDTPAPAAPEPIQEASPSAPTDQGVKEQPSAPPAEAKAEPSSNQDDGPLVPRRALEDERRKRQEKDKALEDLQVQFADLQRKLSQPEPQQQPPAQEFTPPDPWTDPQGAFEYQQRVFQEQLFSTRLITSEEIIRQSKPDYDAMAKIVGEEAQRSPSLQRQILNHPFPAKLIYELGNKIKTFREIGDDPVAYKARVIEEWQAQNQQQAPQAQQSPPEAQKLSVPKSLAGTPSAQPRNPTNGRWSSPASLDDLLGG